jgi:hypothetical protein
MRKSDKIIVAIFMVLILALGGFFIYSGVADLLDTPDVKIENPVTIEIETDSDSPDDSDNNTCPILESISDVTMDMGDRVTILAYATDEDGDTITYTFSDLPDADVDGNKLEWQSLEDHDDEYEVTVTATDGDCAVTHTFTIYIGDGEDDDDDDPDGNDDDDDNDDNDDDPVTPTATYVDLTVSAIEFNSFTNNGQTAEFDIDIQNQGDANIEGDIEIQAELSIKESGIEILSTTQTETLTDLTSAGIESVYVTIDTSSIILEGDITVDLTVTIDPNLTIEESDETNNAESFTIDYTSNYFEVDFKLESLIVNNIDTPVIEIETVTNLSSEYRNIEYIETEFRVEIPESGFVKTFPVKLDQLEQGQNTHTTIINLTDFANQINDIGNPGYDLVIKVILDPYQHESESDETNNSGAFAGYSNCIDFWTGFPDIDFDHPTLNLDWVLINYFS